MAAGSRYEPMTASPNQDPLDAALALADALEGKGFDPVLVGGMALVILGSQRVTRDFDFVISAQGRTEKDLIEVLYRRRLQLVTKFSAAGEVLRTLDNPRVAVARLKTDRPSSLFFFNPRTGLRVDLLLDFPLPARSLIERAVQVRVKSGRLRVASPEDLLRLKEIAFADRKSAADAQDLEFLRRILKSRS